VGRWTITILAACAVVLAAFAAGATAKPHEAVTKPVDWGPRTSKKARKLVHRHKWEPRASNRRENHTVPTKKQRAHFHVVSDMPYARYVNGRMKGTTDEIIQWAAYKWGLDEDVLRAVAVVESWWDMDAVGDGGDSFGLFQMRRPYHCCLPEMRDSTAFNADYYGGIIRAYYDGKMEWLNTVERGRDYAPGDFWGSIGVWVSGRWYAPERFFTYLDEVRKRLAERTWRTDPYFAD
jgi:hypothetical protein